MERRETRTEGVVDATIDAMREGFGKSLADLLDGAMATAVVLGRTEDALAVRVWNFGPEENVERAFGVLAVNLLSRGVSVIELIAAIVAADGATNDSRLMMAGALNGLVALAKSGIGVVPPAADDEIVN